MMKEKIKNQINIYVVNGKVICFKLDVYDLNNSEHVKELLELSVRMHSDNEDDKFYYGGYGDDTILFLDRNPDNPVELTETMGSLRYMPEDVQRKCRLAILKQKNQIVDIDGYIHVVNGKVICFKSDVYDLNNSADVKSLIEYSESLFASSHLKPLYGEQTMYILEHVSDSMRNVCRGDINVFLSNFSEDVQEQVRSAVNEY